MEHQALGWWVVCLIDPAYYIEDCRIFGLLGQFRVYSFYLKFKLCAGLNVHVLHCTNRDAQQMTYIQWLWLLLNWMVFATRGLCLRHLNKKLPMLFEDIWDAKRFCEICHNSEVLHKNKVFPNYQKNIILDIWGIDCFKPRIVKYLLFLLPTYLHSKRCQNSSVPWVNTYLSLQ